jgi:hypothetical protein
MNQLEKKLEKPLFSSGVIADCQYSNPGCVKGVGRQEDATLRIPKVRKKEVG